MELRTGKVVDGRIILEDDAELEEGAPVLVWIREPSVLLEPTKAELDRRLAEHERTPDDLLSWSEIKQRLRAGK